MNITGTPDKLIVKVTEKHIKRGARGSAVSCPIARATRGLFRGYDLSVTEDRISVSQGGLIYEQYNYSISRAGRRFIQNFDNRGRKAVKPFNFVLTRVY